ncbi:phage antirepressor KilAC domain-containing protein [Flavobacterium sp. GNP002]
MGSQIFNYNGNNITFQLGNGDVMVNATEMAKPFGKRPVDYLQNQQTQDFLTEYSKVRKSTLADLVRITKGGNNPGTWMHEDIALEFSRWLSPSFSIWCNDRIKELLKHGMTATPQTLEQMLDDPDALILTLQKLKQERAEKEALQKQLKAQEIKIDFIDRVLDLDEKIDIGQCAKILELPFGRNTLFKNLREKGVFFKNRNEPQQKYIDKGYFQLKEKFIERDNHDSFMVVKVLVTQRGLGFLSTLFKASPRSKKLAKLE